MTTTIVTALLQIGRDELDRSASYYLRSLERLAAIDAPMVLYVSPKLVERVERLRAGLPTQVRALDIDELERLPEFSAMDAIRTSSAWFGQSPWLEQSPQARLPHYLSLIHHKPQMMRSVVDDDPFSSRRFLWLDAGIFSNSLYARFGRWVEQRWLPERGLLVFSYRTHLSADGEEVNGMSARFFCEECGCSPVRFWVRAGLIAGNKDDFHWLAQAFTARHREALRHGELGTEENLLTVLAHRHPQRFHRQKLWFHRWSVGVARQALRARR